MKIFIILFVIIIVNFSMFAQDPQLFENDWYLQKVVINGEDFFPPYLNDEPERGRVYFVDDTIDRLTTSFCDELTFQIIEFEPNNVFNLQDGPIILIGFCILNVNTTYANLYGSVFNDQPTSTAKNPFNYSLVTDNNMLMLTIVNADGDTAIYGNELLSNQDVNSLSVTIYPNPTKNTLQISTDNKIAIKSIEVYDVLGKQLLHTNTVNQIDVSVLATGLLFVKIETNKGVVVKKVIKE